MIYMSVPLPAFFASVMCRLAYEPPIIHNLGLSKVLKILEEDGVRSELFSQLLTISNDQTQDDFFEYLKNPENMIPLEIIAKKINNGLQELEGDIYTEEGVPESERSGPTDKHLVYDKLSPSHKETLQQVDRTTEQFKTMYIHTDHDESVYVTAFRDSNIIVVTFRGTKSVKNSLTDANLFKVNQCTDQNKRKKGGGWFSSKTTNSKAFGGIEYMIESTLHTLMYTILYLKESFIQKPGDPANIFAFGHSLGGGLTTLFAYNYVKGRESLPTPNALPGSIVCITNASPRVLNSTANKEFMELVNPPDGTAAKIKYLRQWSKNDWVPKLPPQKVGFYHPKNDKAYTMMFAQTWIPNRLKPWKSTPTNH